MDVIYAQVGDRTCRDRHHSIRNRGSYSSGSDQCFSCSHQHVSFLSIEGLRRRSVEQEALTVETDLQDG